MSLILLAPIPSAPIPSVAGARVPAPVLSVTDSGLSVPEAAGSRSILDEGTESGPPPAAAARAERIFETTGILLMLAIVVAAAWILLRKHL